MIDEKILLIITSELTDQASKEDLEILHDWKSESRENAGLYHSYKEAFINGKYTPKAKDSEAVYNQLSEKLGLDKIKTNGDRNITRSRISMERRWFRYAAVLLVFLTASMVIYKTKDLWLINDHTATSEAGLVVKSNPRGIKSLITLPDGSKVKLNSESHIEYYSDFSQDRNVKLVGEAFFEVVRDTLRPFYVRTGDLSVKVLGTSFNVKAFPFEQNMQVALVTGKVAVEKQEGFVVNPINYLEPNEMLTYNYQSSDVSIGPFDYDLTVGWKDGELNFKEVGFDEVVKMLERWYGVNITVDPRLDMSGSYTGYYKDERLDGVLEGMGFTYDFDFDIKGEKVYIK